MEEAYIYAKLALGRHTNHKRGHKRYYIVSGERMRLGDIA